MGSSGDSATAATKDAGREEPIAPPRLAFTGSSQVRRYSLELEFYSWTMPNREKAPNHESTLKRRIRELEREVAQLRTRVLELSAG